MTEPSEIASLLHWCSLLIYLLCYNQKCVPNTGFWKFNKPVDILRSNISRYFSIQDIE